MEFAPIILFVYNRPTHTKRTIEALLRNPESQDSNLFVFADGPKDNASKDQLNRIQEVRDYIQKINGFKSVHVEQSEKNKGLANSVIYGVTKIVNEYGRVIVLEDDIVTSSHFLHYMNQSLDLYKNDKAAVCINGYSIIKDAPIKENTYFQYGADCKGWATWQRGWECFNPNAYELMSIMKQDKGSRKLFTYNDTYPFMAMLQEQIEGRIDSWAIRWYASAVLNRYLCLYPKRSLVQDIGFDNTGIHCGDVNSYESIILADETTDDFPKIKIEDSKVMRKEWEELFKQLHYVPRMSFKSKVKQALKRILQK